MLELSLGGILQAAAILLSVLAIRCLRQARARAAWAARWKLAAHTFRDRLLEERGDAEYWREAQAQAAGEAAEWRALVEERERRLGGGS